MDSIEENVYNFYDGMINDFNTIAVHFAYEPTLPEQQNNARQQHRQQSLLNIFNSFFPSDWNIHDIEIQPLTDEQNENIPYGMMYNTSNDDNSISMSVISNIPISSRFGENIENILNILWGNFRTREQNDVMLPMTTEAFDQLEEKKFEDITDSNKCDECAICKEKFENDTIIKILPCKHIFHSECIGQWLKNYHHKCPLCRQECGNYAPKM